MSNENNQNSSIKVEIITPEESFNFEDVYMIVMPGSTGEFGVLQGHVDLIAGLDAGIIKIHDKDNNIIKKIEVSLGFAQITANLVLILVEQASLVN